MLLVCSYFVKISLSGTMTMTLNHEGHFRHPSLNIWTPHYISISFLCTRVTTPVVNTMLPSPYETLSHSPTNGLAASDSALFVVKPSLSLKRCLISKCLFSFLGVMFALNNCGKMTHSGSRFHDMVC